MTPSKLCKSCLPCCQSFTISDYINRTLVPTYLTSGPSTIPPYPRSSGQEDGDPVTDGSCPGGPGTNYPACGQWPITDIPTTGGGYLLSNDQLFELSETPTVTVNICPGPGEKVAQTVKYHHGMYGFTDAAACPDGCISTGSKYLTYTKKVRAYGHCFCQDCGLGDPNLSPGVDFDTYVELSVTVDRYSGKKTINNCTLTFDPAAGCSGFGGPLNILAALLEVTAVCGELVFITGPTIDWSVDSISNTSVRASKDEGPTTFGMLPGQYVETHYRLEMDVDPASEYTSAQVLADAETALSYWNNKNHALFPFSESVYRTVGVIAKYNETGASSPNFQLTSCTLDDYSNPTAGSGTTMDPYTAWAQIAWYDVAAYVWITDDHACDPAHEIATEHRLIVDGSIIGAPFTPGDGSPGLPQGLPDHNFSWSHITWGCYVPDGFPYTTEARFYGAYAGEDATGFDATDLKIPKSSNLWTDQLSANFYYSGSFVMWDNDHSSLTLQKQCESAVKFDAFNLFGPYGYWRHEMNYKISTCITGTTGTADWAEGDTLTFADDDLCNISRTDGFIAAGDSVVLGESGGTFKIFATASVSANNIVLGAEDTARRHVADCYSMWTNASPPVSTGDFGFIGKLFDWKRSGVSFVPPAILGKVAATVAQDIDDPTKVKVTFPQKYTQVGDKIIFVRNDAADTVNNDNSGAGFTLTDVDDAFCKFTGTYDPATMKGLVKILGAPLAKWNSIKSRNTFYWSSCADDGTGGFSDPMNTDDKHHGVNTTLGSTPNNPDDTVAGEWKTTGYPAGDGFPFPTASATTCGGKAWVGVIQDMRHPLVQPPFCCTPPLGEGEPNPCSGFGVCLPRVEAFTQTQMDAWVLAGAPKLPDGITLDVMTTPPIPAGDSCTEPHYLPNPIHAPWSQCVSPWIQ